MLWADGIKLVESNGGLHMDGPVLPDGRQAKGSGQQLPEFVDDFNARTGMNDTYDSRMDEEQSTYRMRYNTQYYGNRPGVEPTDENFSRIYNGGPKGYLNPKTLPYADRVRRAMWYILETGDRHGYKFQGYSPPSQEWPTGELAAKLLPHRVKPAPAGFTWQPSWRRQAQPAQTSAPTMRTGFTARPGDTVSKIWSSRGGAKIMPYAQFLQRFQTANPGVDVNKLKPGMTYR